MCEKKCSCKCKPKDLPVLIGGIVVYELAIIIVLLVLTLFNSDPPCEINEQMTEQAAEVEQQEQTDN